MESKNTLICAQVRVSVRQFNVQGLPAYKPTVNIIEEKLSGEKVRSTMRIKCDAFRWPADAIAHGIREAEDLALFNGLHWKQQGDNSGVIYK